MLVEQYLPPFEAANDAMSKALWCQKTVRDYHTSSLNDYVRPRFYLDGLQLEKKKNCKSCIQFTAFIYINSTSDHLNNVFLMFFFSGNLSKCQHPIDEIGCHDLKAIGPKTYSSKALNSNNFYEKNNHSHNLGISGYLYHTAASPDILNIAQKHIKPNYLKVALNMLHGINC